MSRKNGLRLKLDQHYASAGLQTLKSDIVPGKVIWCLESIAWEISKATSGGNTRCRLFIDRGASDKFYFEEQLTPVANWLYTYDDNVYLYGGERLGLEIDQAQAATVAKLWATGYEEKEE